MRMSWIFLGRNFYAIDVFAVYYIGIGEASYIIAIMYVKTVMQESSKGRNCNVKAKDKTFVIENKNYALDYE